MVFRYTTHAAMATGASRRSVAHAANDDADGAGSYSDLATSAVDEEFAAACAHRAAAIASAPPASSEADFKSRHLPDLPVTRIKRVMKAEPGVRMLATEAPLLTAEAAELFITEFTMRAWEHAMARDGPCTLAREDFAAAAQATPHFDFLCVSLRGGCRGQCSLRVEWACAAARETRYQRASSAHASSCSVGILSPGAKPQYLLDAEARGDTAAAAGAGGSVAAGGSGSGGGGGGGSGGFGISGLGPTRSRGGTGS